MFSNDEHQKWKKKVVKKKTHRSRVNPNKGLPFIQTSVIFILILILGYVGFYFILYLLDIVF